MSFRRRHRRTPLTNGPSSISSSFPRGRRSKFRKWTPGLIILAAIVLIILWNLFSSATGFSFMLGGSSNLKSTNGRVNILLLGIGGGNHDGADLTDSIIVASYSLSTHNVTLFSIPRDLYLPSIKDKINAAYEDGKFQGGTADTRRGLTFAENTMSGVLGIPIHYGILMDFSSFSKAIDLVGGVDVNVPDTFDDYQYPIDGKENDLCGWTEQQMNLNPDQAKTLNVPPGQQNVYVDPTGKIATDSSTLDFSCRFEHIHFNQGMMHMDGATALEFVRSRHALGPEGSDFARSRRQQLVLQAFRAKVLSAQTLFNPSKISGLISDFGSGVVTDVPQNNYLQMYSLAKNVKRVDSLVLGDLGNGKSLFINPPLQDYGGAWVLVPANSDFKTVSDFVATTLVNDDNPSPTPTSTSLPTPLKK